MPTFTFPHSAQISDYDDCLPEILNYCFGDALTKQLARASLRKLEEYISHNAASIYPKNFVACAAVLAGFASVRSGNPGVYPPAEDTAFWQNHNELLRKLAVYLTEKDSEFSGNDRTQVGFYLYSLTRPHLSRTIGPKMWTLIVDTPIS
ncbi:MAG TPA: hypothetical protein VF837_02000 [Patescibacteria group bacterium]